MRRWRTPGFLLGMGTPVTALLELKTLHKRFAVSHAFVHAVCGVDLTVNKGETLGLVGESGCGKSTLARLALRLLEPDQGQILFDGENLNALRASELRKRRKHFQMIFQDPYSSLNPRLSVFEMLAEPLKIHRLATSKTVHEKVEELLLAVGLRPEMAMRYPHEFSGGQRQRLGIARALSVAPKLIIADEPVSALDVSVQAQILNLLMDLQREKGLSYLFIAHDVKVVERLSDRIAVMYLGKIVEEANASELIHHPLHPYTQALLSAVPVIRGRDKKDRGERIVLKGEVPSPRNPPSGCTFHPRCPIAQPRCKTEIPVLVDKGSGHKVSCHMVA